MSQKTRFADIEQLRRWLSEQARSVALSMPQRTFKDGSSIFMVESNTQQGEQMNIADFLENMAINAGIGALMIAIKNPGRAADLKAKLGTLVETICAAYGWTVTGITQ